LKIDVALRETFDAEVELGAGLSRTGERHKAEQDLFHLTHTLRGWCDVHAQRLVAEAQRFGVDLEVESASPGRDQGLVAQTHEKGSEFVGQRAEPALLLLRDLRELHLAAARASLAWTALAQGAQAISDSDLLSTVSACHPETVRTMRWTVQRVKDVSPQAFAS